MIRLICEFRYGLQILNFPMIPQNKQKLSLGLGIIKSVFMIPVLRKDLLLMLNGMNIRLLLLVYPVTTSKYIFYDFCLLSVYTGIN